METQSTILIQTSDDTSRRGGGPQEVNVEVLTTNINIFLNQIQGILETSPQEVGNFKFTEFTVSAEVSAEGKLVLFGSGVEAGVKGGLTFKFERSK